MPKYQVWTIQQVEKSYIVEAKDEQAAFEAMTHPHFIRVEAPPYHKVRSDRKTDIKASDD